jgi:hypothetical protein
MNERIKELAEQAELPVIDGMWDYNDREILRREDGEWRVATPAEIISLLFACEKGREKFAELIVRECANQCDLLLDRKISSEWARGTHDCSKAIKKHFGVES